MGHDLGVPLSRTSCEGEFRGTRKILRHSKYNSLLADANKIRRRADCFPKHGLTDIAGIVG